MTTSIGNTNEYDAIVVGARAAGAATAMLLGRAGQRVLLVDRAQYGADTLSTHALMRGAVFQLHRWGVLDEIRAAGTPPVRRTNFHYGRDVIEIAIPSHHGVDALYAPRRTVLDPALVEAARAAGVEVRFGVRVTGLRRDGAGTVTGITAAVADGEEAVAETGIVIGADGATSTIARLVGAKNSYARTDASAYAYGYFPGLARDCYDWHFAPGVMAGAISTNAGLANVLIGLLFRNVLREAAPGIADALEGVAPVGRLRSFPGRPGHLRTAHGPGWALVGDAGYFKDPGTAHGITDALRDAELLVRSLIATGDAAAYESTRDLLSRPFLEVTTDLASYDWDLREVAALHRSLKAATDEEMTLLASLDPRAIAAA
jgi:flavin-dependent dehydrogenase